MNGGKSTKRKGRVRKILEEYSTVYISLDKIQGVRLPQIGEKEDISGTST